MKSRIRISSDYPSHWEFDGRPVLLLGNNIRDNLFQADVLQEHLRVLKAGGGDLARCVLSSRCEGDVWPFERDAKGVYDLTRPATVYWRLFASLLAMTDLTDIIVQLEIWAPDDFTGEPWQRNPFNPRNNSNYTAPQSGLPEDFEDPPASHPFFLSVAQGNEIVLQHQRRFVNSLLSHSLPYPHILYCIDSQPTQQPEWGAFWAEYIRSRGQAEHFGVCVSDFLDLSDPERLLRETQHGFDFIEASTLGNHPLRRHLRGGLELSERVRVDRPQPINYSSIRGPGEGDEMVRRFWSALFAKAAAVCIADAPRDPGHQIGMRHIRSVRMLEQEMDFFDTTPHPELLSSGTEAETACLANPHREAVVLFLEPGEVVFNAADMPGTHLTLRWLNLSESRWLASRQTPKENRLRLIAPISGSQIALIQTG
ncbi:hypothetical protein HQ520_05035 [bacterium]|nr:hypothetical protein [bacterium]